jgi:tetratricopeptide (TPR) repeat protein
LPFFGILHMIWTRTGAMKSVSIAWLSFAMVFLVASAFAAAGGSATLQGALEMASNGRKAEALSLLQRLTAEDSSNLAAWNDLAALQVELGDLDGARISLEHALVVRPDVAVLSRNLEKICARQARLAYDSAFGTPSRLEPLALELRTEPATANTADRSGTIDSLRLALASARLAAGEVSALRDSLADRDEEISRLESAHAGAASPVVAAASPASRSAVPAVRSPIPARRTGAPQGARSDPIQAVKAWAKAWSDRDVDAYLASYAPDYHPAGLSRPEWEEQRRDRIRKPGWIKVDVVSPALSRPGPDRAEVVYRQVYQTQGVRLTSRKRIELTNSQGEWKIEEEKEAR